MNGRGTLERLSESIALHRRLEKYAYETVSEVQSNSRGMGFPASSLAFFTSKRAAKVDARMKTEFMLK